jgi:hypothetical protein
MSLHKFYISHGLGAISDINSFRTDPKMLVQILAANYSDEIRTMEIGHFEQISQVTLPGHGQFLVYIRSTYTMSRREEPCFIIARFVEEKRHAKRAA